MRENPIFGQIFPQGEKLPEEFSGVERDFQSRMPQQLA